MLQVIFVVILALFAADVVQICYYFL